MLNKLATLSLQRINFFTQWPFRLVYLDQHRVLRAVKRRRMNIRHYFVRLTVAY